MSGDDPVTAPAATTPRAVDRLPLASWRLLVATVAVLGVGYAATLLDLAGQEVGVQAGVLTAATYYALAVAGLVRPAVEWLWWRGALATLLLVAGIGLLLGGGVADERWSVLLHLVLPVLVALDLVLVGRAPVGRWWWASWVVLPLAYLGWYVATDADRYAALDPYGGDYGLTLVGVLAATLATGAALAGLRTARLR